MVEAGKLHAASDQGILDSLQQDLFFFVPGKMDQFSHDGLESRLVRVHGLLELFPKSMIGDLRNMLVYSEDGPNTLYQV